MACCPLVAANHRWEGGRPNGRAKFTQCPVAQVQRYSLTGVTAIILRLSYQNNYRNQELIS